LPLHPSTSSRPNARGSQGDLYDPADLIKRIAGTPMNVKPYLSYLNKKYSELYGF